MTKDQIKVGTIGKIHIKSVMTYNPTTGEKTYSEYDISGVVVIVPTPPSDSYYAITTLGKLVGFRIKDVECVSSIRIGKELREQLSVIAKSYAQQAKIKAEMEKMKNDLRTLEWNTKKEVEKVTHLSGLYTQNEFENKISEYGYRITSAQHDGKSVKVMLQQSNSGERYSKPDVERYFPFVYMEYDGECFLRKENAPKEYDSYVKRNAPAINPAIAKFAKDVSQEVSVGDKYIYATTNYWIHLKNGYTIKDVDAIIDAMN